jgi:CubicO group peptidase (beta-lactamase class C family)
MIDNEWLQTRLQESLAKHDVPGAVVGVLQDGDIAEAAAGVVNLNTGVETTPDTVFQIGSQGKSWTATVAMQLVDEGLLGLDEPIKTYLPDFRVADLGVSETVTLRHLLTHTSGIDGDHFEDFGRGDDCLERYVASCSKLEQTHPLGATMSYCNTGYSITGRLIEVVTGKVWDQAMRERLYTPLGLTHTGTLPEEAILHRVSVGHMPFKPGEKAQVAPVWLLPRITGPAGLINSTARDVLAFAQLFVSDGVGPDGKQVVSADAIKTMKEPQIELPDPYVLGSHWGVGLILFDWDGHRLYGHDGDTLGQHSLLRILPEAGLAVTLLTNGPGARDVYRDLFAEIFSEVAGVTMPPSTPPAPSEPPDLDLAAYAGHYERLAISYELEVDGDELAGTVTVSGPLAAMVPDPVMKLRMRPVDARTFFVFSEGEEEPSTAAFYEFEDGVPTYLHQGARANRRVSR